MGTAMLFLLVFLLVFLFVLKGLCDGLEMNFEGNACVTSLLVVL